MSHISFSPDRGRLPVLCCAILLVTVPAAWAHPELDERVEASSARIAEAPNQAALYLERAKALAAAGDSRIDEALGGLDEGIERLGPIVTLALYAVELELRKNRYDAALKRLDAVMSQSARKERWLLRRGEILEEAGRIDEAREAYTRALEAIETISAHRRSTRAVEEIELKVRTSLVRLAQGISH